MTARSSRQTVRPAWAAIAYLLVTAYVTGCEPPGRKLPPTGSLVIIIGPSRTDPQWPAIRAGARKYARGFPHLQFDYQAPASAESWALAKRVADALKRNPVAICLYVSDPEATRPMIRRILDRGILLVTMGHSVSYVNPYAVVETNFAEGAAVLARQLPSVAAGRRSYMLLHDNGRHEPATQRYDRFMAEARGHYGLSLLEQRNVADSPLSPLEQTRQMTRKFPHAGLMITFDPTPWIEADPDETIGPDTRYVTCSAAPRFWSDLREGRAAALVGPLDGEIGAAAVALALEGLAGADSRSTPHAIACELVTPDTLDDFARRYAEAAGVDLADLLPSKPRSQPASRP